MMYAPSVAPGGMAAFRLTLPLASVVRDPRITGLLHEWLPQSQRTVTTSAAAKPRPVTITLLPGGPLCGVTLRAGLTTTVAMAERPSSCPTAMMLCVPLTVSGTAKLATKEPLAPAVAVATGLVPVLSQ